MDTERVVEDFRHYFSMVAAITPELRDQAYRIRYAVYAEELGWEDKDRFPDKRETDQYDIDSLCCLLRHRASGQNVGCVRLIRSTADGERAFPFESVIVAGSALEDRFGVDWRSKSAEISRIAVVSQFRRRRGERERPENAIEDDNSVTPERRVFPHIAIGLYLGAATMGLINGVARVFAIMEPKLARRLRIYGIEFEAIGEPIEHHGVRIPYVLTRESFEGSATASIKSLLRTITEDLRSSGG
ncbi:MAG: PEP-CTERM/exosortase system-associated acyltransferase [Gammaproteobacteria bacterium]|nr:PEP-CTERM/exosortase system-associated acyltransferase [Gammaproteobacteria bacterium]